MQFDEVFEDKTKYGTKIKTDEYQAQGKNIIVDQGQALIAGYTDKQVGLFTDVPAIVFGDHTRVVKYIDKPFFLGADGVKVLKSKLPDANYKYLYYALLHAKIPNTGYNRHFKWLKESDINYPIPSVQIETVAVLDKVNAVISLYQQQLSKLDELVKARFVEEFGDPVENPKGWERKPLSVIITAANNGMARRGNDFGGSIVIRLVELQDGYIDYSSPNRIVLTDKEKQRYLLCNGDFLFARVNGNPEYVGRCAVFQTIGEPVYHNDHIIRVHFNDSLLNGVFASTLLNSAYGKRQMREQVKTSAGQYTISQDGIGAIVVILPPINLQNQFASFVSQVEKSKAAVQSALDKAQLLFDSLMQKYFE